MNFKELDKKYLKQVFERISNKYGIPLSYLNDLTRRFVFISNKKGKIYIINKESLSFIKNSKNINNILNKYGLYVLTIDKYGIRFSIEGLHLFEKYITKNILELDDNMAKKWFSGKDLEISCDCDGYVIIKYNNYFVGVGLYKNGKIRNFLSKNRRILS